MQELISVIIPAYNAENTIERCINSVYDNNVEIIVIIDGATDATLEKCKKIKHLSDKNIKIIEQINQGANIARKKGIDESSGDYIMFLDDDDCFKHNTISVMRELIKEYNSPDVIRFRYEKVPNKYQQYLYKKEGKIEKKDFKKYVYPMFIEGYMLNSLWNNCIRRDKIINTNLNESNIRYGEDLLWNLKLFSNIDNIVLCNEVLYEYYCQPESVTNSRKVDSLYKNLQDSIYVYSMLFEYLKIWNLDNIENIRIVQERLKKESNKVIDILKNIE